MLKVLLRRQMTEIFRSYFYDAKKNRRRSPTQTVLFLLLFAVLMGLVCFLFGGMAWLLGSASAAAGAGFFYFLIFSLLAVVLGTFGSVFNTYSGLYLSKDNDLLLSLPIPVSVIMISRLLGVYLMGVLYAAAVMAPAILMYQITGGFSLPALLGSLWLFILVTLLVFILSCGLGYLVALLSRRLKNKSFFVVLLSLLFIGIYFFAVSKMQTFLLKLAEQTGEIAAKVKASAYPLYLFGRVGEGDLLAVLLYTLVVCALLFLTLWLISRSFLAIATTPQAHARAGAVKREDRAGSVPGALFRKEVGRFLASPIYILNCGLGVLLLPIAGVFLLIRGSALAAGWESIMGEHHGRGRGRSSGVGVRGRLYDGHHDRYGRAVGLAGGQEPLAGTVFAGPALRGASRQAPPSACAVRRSGAVCRGRFRGRVPRIDPGAVALGGALAPLRHVFRAF